MAHDQTRATMDAYVTAVVERGDFAQFFAPDVVWTTVETGEVIRGRDAVRDYIVAMHTVLFDAHPEPVGMLVGDDHAVLEAVFVGTHEAEFAGVPATGRPVRVPYALIYRVRDGLISDLRAYLPIAALRAQLTEEPATAGAPAHG
jgi:steroid delta-isomerase-like uncharacterized protein